MELKIITFDDFIAGDHTSWIDLDTVPDSMRMDYAIRNANLYNKLPLCGYCEGTGNELFEKYESCRKCGGSGVAK